MLNTIKVCPNGHLIPDSDSLGRTGENNATVLSFSFFDSLNGKSVSDFRKRLVAVLPEGVLSYEIDGEFPLPSELTQSSELGLLVELTMGEEVLFKSEPHIFTFVETRDRPTVNLIQAAVDTVKEEYREELSVSLQSATGDDHSEKTWTELNDTVSQLPVISDEQTQSLGDWDLIKEYFKNYQGNAHHLFTMAPKDDEGNKIYYRLPYIYTPNLEWQKDSTTLSTYVSEAGVDVSSAVNIGGGGANRTFSPLPQLQRFVMTGNANNPSLYNFMATNYELRYLRMETPSEAVLTANNSYYKRAFYRCERLETIDCELDFTGQTDTTGMFTNCYLLKDLRIKPFTLSTSLDLGACRSLHHNALGDYDSLISILNGITDDREISKSITLTFSTEITDFTIGMMSYWNCYVYTCDTGLYYSTLSEIPEGEVSLKIPLYDAFVSKGVTIAWV